MKIDHIGIAVKDILDIVKKFQTLSPSLPIIYEESEDGSMLMAFLVFDNIKIELMQPLDDGSVVARFIQKKGEGIHHIALCVDDIKASIAEVKELGIHIVNETPRVGSGGNLISFLNPKDLSGGIG